MSDVSADKLAKIYIKMRTAKDDLKRELEEKIAAIDEQMDEVSSAMLELCKETGADSIKTEHGTIIRSIKERFWASDKDAFNKFVVENNVPELFESRIHQGNIKQWIADNPDNFPPSVNIDRRYEISVRKPKASE